MEIKILNTNFYTGTLRATRLQISIGLWQLLGISLGTRLFNIETTRRFKVNRDYHYPIVAMTTRLNNLPDEQILASSKDISLGFVIFGVNIFLYLANEVEGAPMEVPPIPNRVSDHEETDIPKTFL